MITAQKSYSKQQAEGARIGDALTKINRTLGVKTRLIGNLSFLDQKGSCLAFEQNLPSGDEEGVTKRIIVDVSSISTPDQLDRFKAEALEAFFPYQHDDSTRRCATITASEIKSDPHAWSSCGNYFIG